MKNQFPFILIGASVIVASLALGYYVYTTDPESELPADPASVQVTSSTPETGEASQSEPTQSEATQSEANQSEAIDSAADEQATGESEVVQAEVQAGVEDQDITEGINQARVRPDGTSVIAGLAPGGSTVRLLRDGVVIGEATASSNGEWVVVPDKLLEPGSHLLSIEITTPDGEKRIGSLALVIEQPEQADETPLMALVPFTEEEAVAQVLQAPDQSVEQASAEPEGETVSNADTNIVTVDQPDAVVPLVTIRTLEARHDGFLWVSGRAVGGQSIMLSIDGETAPTVPVIDEMYSSGMTFYRSDKKMNVSVALDDNGKTVATASVSLMPSTIEKSLDNSSLVIIQKGDALWRIAYQTYGKGIRYVDIYKQNADRINNPDLIYPDQIFILPNRY